MNTERIRYKKFYLAAVVIILAIVSIAASVMFINNNNSSSVLEAKDENPSSNSYGDDGSGGGSGDYSEDGPPYPFRIFFTRGIEIYSTKADGTDLQNHYKGSKSGLGLCNLITSNSGSKLLFYDEESKSVKVLKLATNEIEDLGIKSQFFSLSSDDKKLVCLNADNTNELLIFDIESKPKKILLQKDIGSKISSVPQFISNNSEIIFELTDKSSRTSKMVKFDIKTGNIKNLFVDNKNNLYGQFKLSPDGKLLAFVTRGMLNSLKIYDFESIVDDFREQADLSILQWSPDSKSIYLSYFIRDDDVKVPQLYEYKLKCKEIFPLKDENGKYIEGQ